MMNNYYRIDINGQHMWSGKTSEILHDARRNSAWRDIEQPNATYAFTFASQPFTPGWCNIHGHIITPTKRIMCLTDNQTFDSASAVCKHYGVSQAALSKHLSNKPHYRTVGGHAFKRI